MGSIKGIVKDANDYPLEGASCMIVGGPTHLDISALTDENGRFGFGDLRSGHYKIKIYGNTESDIIPVRVFDNKTVVVRIWMDTDAVDDESNVIDEIN